MANFTAVFEKLDLVDAAVAAASAKIDDLRAALDDSEDQANVDSVAARLDLVKSSLDAAVADPA